MRVPSLPGSPGTTRLVLIFSNRFVVRMRWCPLSVPFVVRWRNDAPFLSIGHTQVFWGTQEIRMIMCWRTDTAYFRQTQELYYSVMYAACCGHILTILRHPYRLHYLKPSWTCVRNICCDLWNLRNFTNVTVTNLTHSLQHVLYLFVLRLKAYHIVFEIVKKSYASCVIFGCYVIEMPVLRSIWYILLIISTPIRDC
jgi:hypothetical protein